MDKARYYRGLTPVRVIFGNSGSYHSPQLALGFFMYIATATGFIDTDVALKREDDVLDHLAAQAKDVPDSFADIAAALYSAASDRAYALGQVHNLAAQLDGAGAAHTVRMLAADTRKLLSAHLLFKRLAQNEHRARVTLGLGRMTEADAA